MLAQQRGRKVNMQSGSEKDNTQIDDAVRFPYSAEPQEGETQTLESTKYERVTDHGYK